ncbi:MAG: hypothetical protein EBS29_08475 [Chloroflexia bacterium]|nr:hypothetical protein [Chloroflexia bacterium]
MQIPDDATVLIGIIKTATDLATLCERQHYHIPVAHAALAYPADYFAAYFPKWHPTLAWHIGYVAQISACRVNLRQECCPHQPAHPRSGQYYINLQLADITPCKPAIPSRHWRRIWLHKTTGATLMRAPELGLLQRINRMHHRTGDYGH